MTRKGFFRTVFIALFFAGLAAGASAQITVSGGFALSKMNASADGYTVEGDIGMGGNIYIDYLLPISIPLSLGFEFGADTSSLTVNGGTDTVLAIPLLLRAAYHFDLFPKLDLYVVGKVGYALGFITSGPSKDYVDYSGGFAFGIDAGVAYYFTSLIGVFAEAGFDDYMIKTKFDISGLKYSIDTPFYRFVTLGISFKK